MSDAALLQPAIERRLRPMPVIKESTIAIDIRVLALTEYRRDVLLIKLWMKLCARTVLNAVHWPPNLRQAFQFPKRTNLCVGVNRKTAMISRVPVLAGNHRFVTGQAGCDSLISDVNGGITFCHA
ncbi:hypothetical protein D3C78_1327410 [compost metagenome]